MKPSAAKSRGVPTTSRTVKSSSPPDGTPSRITLPTDRMSTASASSVRPACASSVLTCSASVLTWATRAALVSPLAAATCLPNDLLPCAGGLEARAGEAPGLVGGQYRVDNAGVLAAGLLRAPDEVRIAPVGA